MCFYFPYILFSHYRSTYGVIACQLVNQAINAIINYTNRNIMSDDPDDVDMIHQAFLLATTASCATALGFRKILSSRGALFAVNKLLLCFKLCTSYFVY